MQQFYSRNDAVSIYIFCKLSRHCTNVYCDLILLCHCRLNNIS